MNKFIYYFLLILVPINIIAYYYLFTNRSEIKEFKEDKITKDTVIKIQYRNINVDSLLFIKYDNVELKSDSSNRGTTKAYLKINSIFYISKRNEQLEQIKIKKKTVSDYWYLINDYNGMSGWIFGYYTSKSLNTK